MKTTVCTYARTEWNRLWACAVLGSAAFPDARLGRRAAELLAQRAERPGDSLLQAAGDSAAAKGNYRFLENDRVTAEHLWKPIHVHTAKKLVRCERVVSIQDTTALMFPGLEATTGLGTMETEREEALLMHSCLAVRPDGQVLGLLGNDVWARSPEEFKKSHLRKMRPIEEKESYKWIRGIRQVTELRDRHSPATKLLHVFDREGDVHEVLQEVVDQGDDCIIRCNYDRNVEGPHGHIRATLAAQPVLTRYKIDVPRKEGQRKRQATVEVRSAPLSLAPARIYPGRNVLELNAVWVYEPNPPEGMDPLDWVLLTTLPVATATQCNDVIETYKLRWLIEDFHRVLKGGCRIEKTQLKTAERIEKLLALLCAVAVRLLALRQWARTEPDAPCTETLSEDEWQVLWAYTHKRALPQGLSPPTMREAILMIGRLGGHLGRKGDGMPGVKTLWQGWRDLQILVEGYHVSLR
jgi:hypothetical protein